MGSGPAPMTAAARPAVRDGFAEVDARFDALAAKRDHNQAQIVDLVPAQQS
ncbi:hypothetical protein [Streptomyces sp. x-80]|uniref:hypothetical protein n=1 Tax=Streptomyces sp. x-80 TaxID=2789282 RepID=UPI00397F605B